MKRTELYTMMKGLSNDPTSRSTISLTNLNTDKTDSFNVPTMSVKRKLESLLSWSDEKLEKVSVKIG